MARGMVPKEPGGDETVNDEGEQRRVYTVVEVAVGGVEEELLVLQLVAERDGAIVTGIDIHLFPQGEFRVLCETHCSVKVCFVSRRGLVVWAGQTTTSADCIKKGMGQGGFICRV